MNELDRKILFETWYIPKGPDDCWLWFGAKYKDGYGLFTHCHKTYLAHRIAYEIKYGDFDKALYVLHKCDNSLCVNPNHLFLGTHDDNMRDMIEKGRNEGQDVKLTADQVKEIRFKAALGITGAEIVEEYKISSAQVSRIITRKRWKEI